MAKIVDIFAIPQEPEKQGKTFDYASGYKDPKVVGTPAYNAYLADDNDTFHDDERGKPYQERNRTFFEDYAERFVKEHPEYEGKGYRSAFADVYENKALPKFENRPLSEERAHHNAITESVTLNLGPFGEYTPTDRDHAHEVSHLMREQILGSSDWGSDKELGLIGEAYDFIPKEYDMAERMAVNTELRKRISEDNGGATGAALTEIISKMPEKQLIKYLDGLNGYTAGRRGVRRAVRWGRFKRKDQGKKIRQALIEVASLDNRERPRAGELA